MGDAKKSPFRARLRAGERLLGTFLKSPAIASVEILALSGLDFLVIDEEHAPIDRAAIDGAVFACRAMGMAAFVRVRSAAPEAILSALDCGATGVMIPHVSTEAQAQAAAAACRYAGTRGYSGAVRSSGYGSGRLAETLARADEEVIVIAQIEDAHALDAVTAIADVEGIDALFIGRGDLAVSLRALGSDAPAVRDATVRIAAAAAQAGKPISVFVTGPDEAADLAAQGATMFVYASDQALLRKAATAAVAAMRNL